MHFSIRDRVVFASLLASTHFSCNKAASLSKSSSFFVSLSARARSFSAVDRAREARLSVSDARCSLILASVIAVTTTVPALAALSLLLRRSCFTVSTRPLAASAAWRFCLASLAAFSAWYSLTLSKRCETSTPALASSTLFLASLSLANACETSRAADFTLASASQWSAFAYPTELPKNSWTSKPSSLSRSDSVKSEVSNEVETLSMMLPSSSTLVGVCCWTFAFICSAVESDSSIAE
mmetsp:Transcript_13350/g.19652  ORF Transcript_13350/g.19652 Transcript_13350/m.19652 type:complete len:238 (-) Transcript_13350:1535-2248(-)